MKFDPTNAVPVEDEQKPRSSVFDPTNAVLVEEPRIVGLENSKRTMGQVAGDVGVALLKGAIGLPQAMVGLADIPTGGRVGKALESIGYRPDEATKIVDDWYSDPQKRANAKVQQADGFVDTVKAAIDNPSTVAMSALESAPSMVGGAGMARGLMKVAPKIAPVAAAAFGEGAVSAGQSAAQSRNENADRLLTPKQSIAAVGAGGITGLLGFAGGKLAQRLGIADVDTLLASGEGQKVTKGFVRQVIGAGISEGVFEELPQSAQEQMWQNYATGKPIMEGVGNASAQGMMAGAAMGAVGGASNPMVKTKPAPAAAEQETSPGPALALPPPVYTGTPSSDLLVSEVDRQRQIDAAQANADAIYAERAQFEASRPQQETSPGAAAVQQMQSIAAAPDFDRLSDSPVPDVGAPMVSVRNNAMDEAVAPEDMGSSGTVTLPDGSKVGFTYAVVDAGNVLAPSDVTGQVNPAYAAARPGQLVALNNGRTAGLQEAYARGTATQPGGYTERLVQNASRFGLSPEAVSGKSAPMLVRMYDDTINARPDFARQMNRNGPLGMSAQDVARNDAARLPSLSNLVISQDGNFDPRANAPFVQGWLASLPQNERASVTDGTGNLSPAGLGRLRNAVIAKAYGDNSVFGRLVESFDGDMKNVGQALVKAAPKIAKVRELIASGVARSPEIGTQIDQAVNELIAATMLPNGMPPAGQGRMSPAVSAQAAPAVIAGNPSVAELPAPDVAAQERPETPAAGIEPGGFDPTQPLELVPEPDEPKVEPGSGARVSRQQIDAPKKARTNGKQAEPAKVDAASDQGRGDQRSRGKGDTPDRAGVGSGTRDDATAPVQRAGANPSVGDASRGDGTLSAVQANPVDAAAHDAATSPSNDLPEPSQAQKEANNYRHGHLKISGLDISIENPEGSTRSGIDPGGRPWSVRMKSHYGYLLKTEGRDGDHVDVFVKPGTAEDYAGQVFVIDQKKPGNGHFDEHKVMLGWDTEEGAVLAYKANYTKGWDGIRAVTPMGMDQFKQWLRNGDTKAPVSAQENQPFRSYSKERAEQLSKRMTQQGLPSEAYLHPSGDGSYAIRAKAPESRAIDAGARKRLDSATSEIRGIADKFKAEFKGVGALDLRVVGTAEDIPKRLRPSQFAEGVYHDDAGLIYLVTDNLMDGGRANAERAIQVLMHECVGHFGIAAMMGDRFRPILKHVMRVARDPSVKEDIYGPGDRQYVTVEAVKLRYPEATDAEIAQEVMARMAETESQRLRYRHILAIVRQWFRDVARAIGIKVETTMDELNDLIAKASVYMRAGRNLEGAVEPMGLAAASNRIVERDRTNIETAMRRMDKFIAEFESGRMKDSDTQILGPTPTVLQALGAKDLPLQIDGATIRKVLAGKHRFDISPAILRQVPAGIYDPLLVFKSATGSGKVVVTELASMNGKPVVAAIHFQKRHGGMIINDVSSIHEKTDAATAMSHWIRGGLLEYARNENDLLGSATRHPLPASVTDLLKGHAKNVLQEADVVKSFGPRYSVGRDTIPRMPDDTKASGQKNTPAPEAANSEARHIAAARQMVAAIESDGLTSDYGIRVIPGEFEGNLSIGDGVEHSRVWDGDRSTDEFMDGVSVAEIRQPNLSGVLSALNNLGATGKKGPNGYYFGNRVVLVKGNRIQRGQDVGEAIFSDPVIVGVWTKPSKGLSEVRPNESSAPVSSGAMESRRHFAGDSGRQYSASQQRTFRNIGREIETPTLKERVAGLWENIGKKLQQGIADQFAPLKDLDKQAYLLSRMSKGADGALEAMLMYGRVFLNGGIYDVNIKDGGVLDKLLRPLGKEVDDFMWWIAGNRAEQLAREGREHLMTQDDIANLKALSNGPLDFDYKLQNGKTTRDRATAYHDAQQVLSAFNKSVLDISEQSGLIDGADRSVWEKDFYVPFYREAEEGEKKFPSVKKGLVRQKAFERLKGGTDKLNHDLLANTLMNWSHMLNAAAKNRAAKASLDAAERAGAATKAPAGEKGDVYYRDAGKEIHYTVGDPFILDAITALEFSGFSGPAMKVMSAFKRWLTMGVTASPTFKIRNLIRDSISAIGQGELSYNPITNLRQGFKGTEKTSQTYASMLAGGGLIRFGTMIEGNRADHVRRLVEEGVDPGTIIDSESKLQAVWKRYIMPAVDAYNELGDRSEGINRAALYEQLRAKGMGHAEANFAARDLLDFSMGGTSSAVRFLTQVVPFANARIQGLYKLGRAAKENPKRMGYVVGTVALARLALLSAYHDDDDWKKREDWDRDNYWWFKIGGTAFRIPKPFEIGAIGTLAERSAELLFDKEMDGERFGKRLGKMIGDTFAMNPVPQMFKPLLDIYSNIDSFTGRQIETAGMERLRTSDRFTARTSEVAKILGKAEVLSPAQIDHLIRGYFGWLGTAAVTTVDQIVRVGEENERPSMQLRDVFLVGNFVETLPTNSSRYVTQMYDQSRAIEEAYNSWRHYMKIGDKAKANEIFNEEKDEIKQYRQVQAVKRSFAELNAQSRLIEADAKKSGDQKRAELDRIAQRKNTLAKSISAAGLK